MEKSVVQLIDSVSKLDYSGKKAIYNRIFSTGVLDKEGINTISVSDKMVLISLISLTFIKMKVKKPEILPLDILLSITKQKKDNSAFYQFLEALSIIVEDFSYAANTADPCGLKTSQEIISKIKELLNLWIPF